MFIPRIYYPQPLNVGDTITFDKDRAHYLLTVLRLISQDEVIIFNGQGGEYDAQLIVDKKRVHAKISAFKNINRESPLEIHLGQALARGDKMDFIIQKATELGVSSITPLFSKQSHVKLDQARIHKRMEHWQNIAISAAEQSGRLRVPTLYSPVTLEQWVRNPFQGFSLVFSPASQNSLKSITPGLSLRVAIGPESGWDDNEVRMMLSHQFTDATLGPRILRAETASMSALTMLQGFYGDLCEVASSTINDNF
ncbi:MAG: 16S rRNA (uracil(1498)-N(3))-methyltransferase [Proteobacteria bacterium]|nr:16S rRNA (uracil(1498)-N(3))-methyltransferase [Pseudomonadota bacterium]